MGKIGSFIILKMQLLCGKHVKPIINILISSVVKLLGPNNLNISS